MKNNLDLFEIIAEITNPYKKNKTYHHNSILLPKGITVVDEFGNIRKVLFLVEGQKVVINEFGEIENLNDRLPTHQITHLWSYNDIYGMTVINLKTKELTKVQL